MIIDVLVCRLDGTQVIEQREVDDDYFPPESPGGSELISEAEAISILFGGSEA